MKRVVQCSGNFYRSTIYWIYLKFHKIIFSYKALVIVLIFIILLWTNTHLMNSNKIIKTNIENYNTVSPTIQNLLHYYLNSSRNVHEPIYNSICPNFGDNIKIVFLVISSPANEEARNNIRKTWGSFSLRTDLAVGFIIGSSGNEQIDLKLKTEQFLYGDLIRVNVHDTYNNLTLKTTLMLHWVTKYCNKAGYVFKVDDDVFVNVNLILDLLHHGTIRQNRSIYGRLARNWEPVREENLKNYISRSHYSPDIFPDFTTGPAYIFPRFLALELYNEALSLPYIEIEDVFYTGIAASNINVSRINIPGIMNRWVPLDDCNLEKTVTIHSLRDANLYYAWYMINRMDRRKCTKLRRILQDVKNFFNIFG